MITAEYRNFKDGTTVDIPAVQTNVQRYLVA